MLVCLLSDLMQMDVGRLSTAFLHKNSKKLIWNLLSNYSHTIYFNPVRAGWVWSARQVYLKPTLTTTVQRLWLP
jgi:hypothetical protein